MRPIAIALSILLPLCVGAVDFDFDRFLERFDETKFIGAGAGFSHEYDDELFGVSVFGDLRWEPAGFGFNVPLRWLVHDGNGDTDTVAGMPTYDWDEARDYVRLITYAQYGHHDDEVYLYLGEHRNRYIGHGTLLGGYFNNIRLNHPSRGVYALLQTEWAGGELFLSDVAPPDIIGGRAFIKPASFFDKDSYANNLEVGVSWFSDIFMPETIELDQQTLGRSVDRVFDSAIGLDVSFRALALRWWHLTPYMDWNLLRFGGNGLHFGLLQQFDIPVKDDTLSIRTVVESRVYQRDYSPQYFGTFYDIEKERYYGGETKYWVHSSKNNLGAGPWYTGWYGDIVLYMVGSFSVGGSFEWNEYLSNQHLDTTDQGVRRGRFTANIFGDLILFERLRLGLFFTRADAGRGGFFDLADHPSLLSVSASYAINEYFSASAHCSNGYRLHIYLDPNGTLQDRYRSEIQFGLGFSAGYGF